MGNGYKKASVAIALGAALFLTACAPSFRNHGFVPRDDQLQTIDVGADTRESVTEKIGGPSASSLRRDNAWYYVESRFRHVGFSAPREIERQVVRISFSPSGRVQNIERFGLADGQIVRLSTRVTETVATDRGFLGQLFGNVGQGSAAALLN